MRVPEALFGATTLLVCGDAHFARQNQMRQIRDIHPENNLAHSAAPTSSLARRDEL